MVPPRVRPSNHRFGNIFQRTPGRRRSGSHDLDRILDRAVGLHRDHFRRLVDPPRHLLRCDSHTAPLSRGARRGEAGLPRRILSRRLRGQTAFGVPPRVRFNTHERDSSRNRRSFLRLHGSGCRDLNPGPQRPERCALTKLRHTPWSLESVAIVLRGPQPRSGAPRTASRTLAARSARHTSRSGRYGSAWL